MTSTDQPADSSGAESGTQDVAGWGLLGLTVGTLAGFFLAYYGVIRMLPKTDSTLMITVMTSITVVAMTLGGGIGYVATRKKSRN